MWSSYWSAAQRDREINRIQDLSASKHNRIKIHVHVYTCTCIYMYIHIHVVGLWHLITISLL